MSQIQFDSIFGTNYVPTDVEIVAIKEILKEPLARLAKVEEELAGVELKARNLRQEQEDLNRSIDKYRSLICPMRRFPPDILREIFISCLPLDRNPTMSNDEAPMLLTQVSSHWRSLAMTTPGLWAALHIAVPKSSPVFDTIHDSRMGDALMVSQLTEIRAAAVKEWIARSGTLPLSISLCGWDILPPIDYCKIFFQWILPSSSRWKNISLACPAASLTDFRAIPPSEVPILQALSFTISHSKATPDAEWNDCGLFQASSLRKFSISGINTDISYLPLNWSKLTHLSLNGDTLNGDQWSPMGSVIDAFTRLLERCFGLVSCRVYVGYGANPGNRTEFPTFSLPLLESLWVFEMEQIPGFLAAFDAPKLRKIEYWTPRSSTAGPSFLTRLLSNSGGGVQEVSTDPRLFSAHDLVKYLHLCPSLTSLSLSLASPGSSFPTSPMPHDMSDSPISDSLLQSFAHSKADDECLCPNLEKFTCLTEAHFSDDALLEFILRKQSGEDKRIKKLKSVNVTFTRRPTVDIMPQLSMHISDGLKISITYPPRTYRGTFSLYDGLPEMDDANPYSQPLFR